MAAASKHVDLKIVFLGASGVGKTSIVQRYMENTFEPTQVRTQLREGSGGVGVGEGGGVGGWSGRVDGIR